MYVRTVAAPSSDAPVRDGEAGFTIIELMVALGLLTIFIGGIAGVFMAGLRTAGTSNHRTDASSLATQAVEGMHAVPYANLGFYGDQTGYVATFDGHSTVSLGTTTPAGSPSATQPQTPDPSAAASFNPDPDPTNANPVALAGIPFSIRRYVVWVDAKGPSGATYASAYKRTTVIVSWTDQVGAHTVRQDSIVYPGGLGTYGGSGPGSTTTTAAPLPPIQPTLNAPTHPLAPANATELDLTWTQPVGGGTVTSYSLQYSTTAAFTPGTTTSVSNIAPTAASYSIQSLAASTTYYVQLIAYAGSLSATSGSVSGMTAAAPAPCVIGTLTVTGATSASSTGTLLQKNGKMSENLTLGFTTTGTCSSFYAVKATYNGAPDTGPPVGPYTLTNSGSGQYNGSILSTGNKSWSTGTHTFVVWDMTANLATSALKAFKVCTNGTASC
jgi:hypothetical protein